MSKQRFEPGDIVLCVTTERWQSLVTDEVQPGPLRGSVGEVVSITVSNGMMLLGLAGWADDYFEAEAFRKIERLSADEHREAIRELAEDSQRRKVTR